MDNFLTYLKWRGDLTFSNAPFNEVDNLLLSQVAYVDFSGIVPDIDSSYTISFKAAARIYRKKYEDMEVENMSKLVREWGETFLALSNTKRFGNLHLSKYVRELRKDEESQFAAVTIELEDNSVYIAYSGTDTSVIGWKENFNMSFLKATPGQKKAVEYLENVAKNTKSYIRAGGHSKGGNLAIYAAMHACKEVRNRLLGVYNNDGPGFTKKMILQKEYEEILPRIHTFVPQSSIIGMLLFHEENIEIIASSNVGFLQHDAISWGVLGDRFLRVDKREKTMVKLDKTIKNWLDSLDDKERAQFVDILFSVLEKAKIYDIDILGKMSPGKVLNLIKAADELPYESKKYLRRTVKLLIDAWINLSH